MGRMWGEKISKRERERVVVQESKSTSSAASKEKLGQCRLKAITSGFFNLLSSLSCRRGNKKNGNESCCMRRHLKVNYSGCCYLTIHTYRE